MYVCQWEKEREKEGERGGEREGREGREGEGELCASVYKKIQSTPEGTNRWRSFPLAFKMKRV